MVREGIYVNGKEIAERYIGGKLVWPKEIVLVSDTMSISNFNPTEKRITISYMLYSSADTSSLEPYKNENKRQEIIKNSYIVINNVKYKDVTIYFYFYADHHSYFDCYFILQFQKLTSYKEVMQYLSYPYQKTATIIIRKQ